MAADTTTGSASAGTAPTIALGGGFTPAAFTPGRYATAIQRTMYGTHDVQVLSEDTTSSFLLELGADGAATACRGWRTISRNDGPEVQTEDRYREQQGYRGRYTVAGGVAEVVLRADDTVCPHVFEGQLALVRAPGFTLRCVVATTSDAALPAPVLLCQPVGAQPTELELQVVASIAPPGWFALGSGDGLRVRVTGRPEGAHAGEDVRETVEAGPPVGVDAWERAF